jgi:energy-coupling factor transport system substrate-specific component
MVSAWQTMALAASPVDPFAHYRSGSRGAVSYLVTTVRQDRDAGSIERTILAIAMVRQRFPLRAHAPATAVRPADVGGVDLIARLRADFKANGSVEDQCNLTAFAILALRAAGRAVPARTVAWLSRQQDDDGGFNFATGGAASDVDDTGAVLEALAGTGHAALVRRAVGFIRAQQNPDGGFPSTPGAASNAQSTAFAVQGLIAARSDPAKVRRRGSRSPLAYLRSLIQPDGAVDYQRGVGQTPVWVTAQAELALAGRVL